MGLRDYLERIREKKNRYKEYEDQMKIAEKYEERKLSSNERELRRFMKEEREDSIKKELEEFRNKRQHEAQYGNQIIKVKNMFSPKNNKSTILNQRNLFTGEKNLFTHGRKR